MCLFAGAAATFTMSKPQSSPSHFPLPKRCKNGVKFGNIGRELCKGQGCLPLGTSFSPLLRKFPAAVGIWTLAATAVLRHPPAPLGAWAADPSTFTQSKEWLMWPRAVPIRPALCAGSFLAEPGFPHRPTATASDLLFSQRDPHQQLG